MLFKDVITTMVDDMLNRDAVHVTKDHTPKVSNDAADTLATIITTPSFDVVRIDKQGYGVIAGRAHPLSDVTLYNNDDEFTTVRADANGEWVFVLPTPLSAGSHDLRLYYKNGSNDYVFAQDHAIIYVNETDEAPLIANVNNNDAANIAVTQQPEGAIAIPLNITTISYDDSHDIIIKGTGKPRAALHIYFNDAHKAKLLIDDTGMFEAIINDIAVGRYTLRLDALVGKKVHSRLEIPFIKEAPAQQQKSTAKQQHYVVQPGNSLWRISRNILGQGTQYIILYNLNKNFIKNPDLIYPGQILTLPSQ